MSIGKILRKGIQEREARAAELRTHIQSIEAQLLEATIELREVDAALTVYRDLQPHAAAEPAEGNLEGQHA